MKDVKPFFVPRREHIRASVWNRLVDGEWEPLGPYVEDWDQRTVLHLRCTLAADVEAVRAATRLQDGSPLSWAVGWRATDTGLVGDPMLADLAREDSAIDLDIPPERAGATVVLTRRLVLRRNRMARGVGEARWAGSILWSDETPLRLTGRGAAFPSEIVDFRTYGHDPAISWYLELPSTPDVPAMGAMLLLINSADTMLVDAVTRRRPTEQQQILIQCMEEGVIEQLVRWALARWAELDDVEEGTVGAAGRVLTNRVLSDPSAWTDPEIDAMDLYAAVIGGSRRIGWGRALV